MSADAQTNTGDLARQTEPTEAGGTAIPALVTGCADCRRLGLRASPSATVDERCRYCGGRVWQRMFPSRRQANKFVWATNQKEKRLRAATGAGQRLPGKAGDGGDPMTGGRSASEGAATPG